MEVEWRGAKTNCSGTTDSFLIDRMICQDSHNAGRNLSMAWINVLKAFDAVSHEEIMSLHKFSRWLCKTVETLHKSWNTKIVAHTKQGQETSEVIYFNKGHPQVMFSVRKLFTLCIH